MPRRNHPAGPRRGRGRGGPGPGRAGGPGGADEGGRGDQGGRGGGPPLVGGWLRTERDASDREWAVRSVSGAAATKDYRCPGCDQTIPPGTPHVVAWPADDEGGAGAGGAERRHWHTGCWRRRRA